MNNFSELTLSAVLKDNLAAHGFTVPTAVQAQAIPPALAGRDIVATAQTGTGKTLAFVLPMLETLIASGAAKTLSPCALILSPTRELAIQINETFAKMSAGSGIRATVVVGGLNEGNQLKALKRGPQVIIATPGRLIDFLERRLVKLTGVRTLVLDEADRMLDMGFLPAIKAILSHLPSKRQTLFFSATIEKSVAHLVDAHLNDPARISIGSISKPSDNVDNFVYEVEQDRKLGLLEHMLRQEQGTFLIFARTKHGADRLSKKLVTGGIKATSIHGGRTQAQRNNALKGFQQGQYRVLVATDVAARGIHVEAIGHVINHDLPQVPEDFIHRVGRTGRAGSRGQSTTFATRGESSEVRRIERSLGIKLVRKDVPNEVQREAKVTGQVIVLPVGGRSVAPAGHGDRQGGFYSKFKKRAGRY